MGVNELSLSFWDATGQEDFLRLMALSLTGADVVIVGFVKFNPASLADIQKKVSVSFTIHGDNLTTSIVVSRDTSPLRWCSCVADRFQVKTRR